MWTTRGLPIVPFLSEFTRVAREDGYEYVLLLVARPADDYLLYENLFRDWTSIHHLTGTEMMFLFVGPNAAAEKEPPGVLVRNQMRADELIFSPHVGSLNLPKRSANTGYPSRMKNGYAYAKLTERVASLQEFDEIATSHESQVKELRREFSLTEAELPALVLITLHDDLNFSISIRGVISLYSFLKFLVDEIEKGLAIKNRIREVALALQRFRKSSDGRFCRRYKEALDALSDAPPRPSKLLDDLQTTLAERLPWDREQKSTILDSLLRAIKSDADAAWYYQKHRGDIQSIIHILQSSNSKYWNANCSDWNGFKKLSDEQHDIKNQLSSLNSAMLERALQNHFREEYRSSAGPSEVHTAKPDVFISYSRADIEAASLIEQYLKNNGFEVWRDEAVRAGLSFRWEIRAALLAARSIVVLWTKNSIKSEWVEWEASMAYRRKRLIPLSDGTVAPHHLPAPFGNLQLLNVSEKEKLLASIQETIAVGANINW